MSFTNMENDKLSSKQNSWLKEFMEKEVTLNVWSDVNSDGFPLWVLIRGKALVSLAKSRSIYSNIKKTKTNGILDNFREHLRAFYHLFLDQKTCFDAVFWTPAHYLHPEKGDVLRNDRVHGAYYPLFSRPLILEKPNNGVFFRKIHGVSSKDVFLSSSIDLIHTAIAKANRLDFSTKPQDERLYNKLLEKTVIISENTIKKARILDILKSFKRANWSQENFARILAKKNIKKTAFLHGASYLGTSALLSWHLHRYGFSIIEPQHGTATADHYAYNYPEEIFDLPGVRSVFPDYFLTFGEKWGEIISIPSKVVSVGNPYLESIVRKHTNKPGTDILVISQGTDRVTNLVRCLSKAFPTRRIVFKLHPREIAFAENYKDLESMPNVFIKGTENESILPMIGDSDIIVGFFSTALFEALAFPGKMVCCLPHPYTVVEPEFNIFNDEAELIRLIENGGKRVSPEVSEKYWKKNWSENIKELPFLSGKPS